MLTALLALMLLIPTGALASGVSDTDVSKPLEKIAAEKAALLAKISGAASVQYALIDEGKIKVSGQTGINDLEGKKPLTKDTMYGIGSTSKMFTTAAVMKLVDQGKINLDTPLVQYIPDFTMKDERYKQITPRMLLNHSSGLMGSSLKDSFLFEDNDTYAHDSLLKQLSKQGLKADPGAFSVYCNDGFTLAEILVERVSGTSFTAFIHNNFTEPLEMKNTKTPQDRVDPAKMAGLYYPAYQGQLPNETVNVIGTGGIYSTAEDLLKFSQIFTGQKSGILSDASVKAMEQEEYKKGLWPEDADNSIDYGLGWDSVRLFPFNDYGVKALVKGGDTILYHASLVVLPDQNMAVAVLSSGSSSSLNQLLGTEILLQGLKEKGVIKEIKPVKSFGKPVKTAIPDNVMKHAGFYGSMGQQTEIILNKDGELTLKSPTSGDIPGLKYVYTANGSFVSEDGSSKINFETKNGRTYLWVREYATVPDLGQIALSHYAAEKLEEHTISKEVEKAWAKREGKTYYPINEKYSSVAYLIAQPSVLIERTAQMKGYIGDRQITGPDTAVSPIQIPAMSGRDMVPLNFFTEKGTEYLEAAGSLYVSEEKVKPLYSGKHSVITLQKDGYARWFTVPKKAAGKTMTVSMPAKAAFAVYDEQGALVNYSVVSHSKQVKLPANGTVVFAGEAGSKFDIHLK